MLIINHVDGSGQDCSMMNISSGYTNQRLIVRATRYITQAYYATAHTWSVLKKRDKHHVRRDTRDIMHIQSYKHSYRLVHLPLLVHNSVRRKTCSTNRPIRHVISFQIRLCCFKKISFPIVIYHLKEQMLCSKQYVLLCHTTHILLYVLLENIFFFFILFSLQSNNIDLCWCGYNINFHINVCELNQIYWLIFGHWNEPETQKCSELTFFFTNIKPACEEFGVINLSWTWLFVFILHIISHSNTKKKLNNNSRK